MLVQRLTCPPSPDPAKENGCLEPVPSWLGRFDIYASLDPEAKCTSVNFLSLSVSHVCLSLALLANTCSELKHPAFIFFFHIVEVTKTLVLKSERATTAGKMVHYGSHSTFSILPLALPYSSLWRATFQLSRGNVFRGLYLLTASLVKECPPYDATSVSWEERGASPSPLVYVLQ